MKLIRLIKQQIPNTITLLNLLSGCFAIVFAFRYNDTIGCLNAWQWAFVCIGLATIFDFCDGLSARLLHAYSAVGKELDSLADLVSFGLAPAALAYNAMTANGSGWLAIAAFITTAFGALRLARFNVDDRQTTSFIGLPIPSNAIFWIGAIAWVNEFGYPGDAVMIILSLATAYLMVCNLRMFSLKVKSLAWKGNALRYTLIAATIAGVCAIGLSALAFAIILYIILSLIDSRREQL